MKRKLTRRGVLKSIGNSIAGLSVSPAFVQWSEILASSIKNDGHILVRSSWQTINIGDIAHTPGILRLLEEQFPDVKITLWASDVGDGVEKMLMARFPKLNIISTGETDHLEEVIKSCDFLLHGSGPFLVGRREIDFWRKSTNKPYGVFGITFGDHEELPLMIDLLNQAEFVLFRDSDSLKYAKDVGVNCKIMRFGPDAAFAVDLRNDIAALKFLNEHQLTAGNFVCVIPRLRYTPNWKIPSKNRAFDPVKDKVNRTHQEHDHAPLREAISEIVKNTDLNVLICPEDVTQIEVGRELLLDRLSAEIRKRVVWRSDYWLTDEALSTYIRSVGLFGLEMHSPIMCIGNGIPAIVGRFKEQTSKGIMWKDVGLEKWLFDMDNELDYKGYVPSVMSMIEDKERSKKMVDHARHFVMNKFTEGLTLIK